MVLHAYNIDLSRWQVVAVSAWLYLSFVLIVCFSHFSVFLSHVIKLMANK